MLTAIADIEYSSGESRARAPKNADPPIPQAISRAACEAVFEACELTALVGFRSLKKLLDTFDVAGVGGVQQALSAAHRDRGRLSRLL